MKTDSSGSLASIDSFDESDKRTVCDDLDIEDSSVSHLPSTSIGAHKFNISNSQLCDSDLPASRDSGVRRDEIPVADDTVVEPRRRPPPIYFATRPSDYIEFSNAIKKDIGDKFSLKFLGKQIKI